MKEEILCAEVDLAQVSGSRYMFDVAGHYGRPDVFELLVHQEPRPMVRVDGAVPRPKATAEKPAAKRRARRR